MSSGKKIAVIVLAIAIVAVIITTAVLWYGSANTNQAANNTGTGSTGSAPGGTGASVSITRSNVVPAGVVAPNKGATALADVAIPVVQGSGDPSGNVDYRSFSIAIQNGAYTPDTVIVNQGDTVNLEITAVDGNYGFDQPDYGLSATIAKGKTQIVQFQALAPGNFTFYCPSCGGPSKGPVGHIMVVAK
jgi:heme/copper-type cytochrome/quinol oxidase subunit 2